MFITFAETARLATTSNRINFKAEIKAVGECASAAETSLLVKCLAKALDDSPELSSSLLHPLLNAGAG